MPPAAKGKHAESGGVNEGQRRAQPKSASTDAAAPLTGGASATLLFQIAPPGEAAVAFIDGRKVGRLTGIDRVQGHAGQAQGRDPWQQEAMDPSLLGQSQSRRKEEDLGAVRRRILKGEERIRERTPARTG